MEDIHNKYKHFDWYPAFMIALINSTERLYFSSTSTLVDAFHWKNTAQGLDYWGKIHSSLITTGYILLQSEADILEREALNFYKPLYEQYKLTHPELFV